ncbi:MAG: AMP-binding protein [Halofilum sp. (in: g-proteobacteria)]
MVPGNSDGSRHRRPGYRGAAADADRGDCGGTASPFRAPVARAGQRSCARGRTRQPRPDRAHAAYPAAFRLAAILDNAQARVFIADPRTRPAGRVLQGLVPSLRTVETVERLRHSREPPETVPRAGGDLAFLQYTSGTTGVPKGVMLTHANLLANIRAMGLAIGADASDRFISWLPLYHDMGLIGACLATLYYGIEVILMSPLQFMARPERWLRAIHDFGDTISAGPDLAYDLCAGRVCDEVLEGLDLSSRRLAFKGAEPVSADTLERFTARFAPFGFRAGAMMPVYGLAESSVGKAEDSITPPPPSPSGYRPPSAAAKGARRDYNLTGTTG